MIGELKVGQRVVHRRYGPGVVVRIREGKSDEEHDRYYVIDIPSRELTLHLPATGPQPDLRGLSSPRRMSQAMRILCGEPCELPKDYRERQAFVTEHMTDGVLLTLAEMIRDLSALHSTKRLSLVESNLLHAAKQRLAGELAFVADIKLTEAVQRVDHALLSPAKAEPTASA